MDKTRDARKTKAQLIEELQALRRQLAKLQGGEEKGREQAEESPLRERDMLHALMENVPDWIFFKDAESRIVRGNRAHAQLLGFDDPQEIVGKTDFDLFPSKDAQRFYDEEQKMLQSDQPVVARLGQTPSRDGEVLWVSETKIPLKDATGRVIGLVGISRNVTEIKQAEEVLKEARAEIEKQVEERTAELKQEIAERKRTEAALARESELLQALLDNSPDYIFFKDRKSRFIRTNKTHAQNLLGISDPREVVGKTDFDLYPEEEENTQRFYDEEQRLMESGEPVVSREWMVPSQATGEEVWLSEHKIPILGETGEIVGLVCIGRDITAHKRAEERLQRYAVELEQANEEIKQFAYIVSHDLRAPLVNLKGFAAELRAALAVIGSGLIETLPYLAEQQRESVTLALQEDVPEALEFIDASVNRMDDFINAVLKLSRLGHQELKPEPLDTDDIVRATLQTLAHQIEQGGMQVAVGPLPDVVADRTAMEQTWGNLLGNAVKYIDPNRPGEIEISAERSPGETTFHVRDNGRGIAERDMDKVFAPFRRAGKQDVPGEGMGLAFVQTLLRRHGGSIWYESEPGVGTTFTFTIPDEGGFLQPKGDLPVIETEHAHTN